MKDLYVTGSEKAQRVMDWLSDITRPLENVFLIDAITPRIAPQAVVEAGQMAVMHWVSELVDEMYYRLAGSDALLILLHEEEPLHANSAFEAGVMFAMRKPIAVYTENEGTEEQRVLIPASLFSRLNAVIRGRSALATFMETL